MWGAIAGAVGGALASGLISAQGQREANDANKNMSREQMRFQANMSNTAYQRQRRDLEKAGYNPMLAYSQGPASTPTGSQSTMQNEAPDFSQAVTTLLTAKQQAREEKMADSSIKLQDAQAKLAAENQKVAAETAKKVQHDTNIAKYNEAGAKAESEFQSKYGEQQRKANAIMDVLSRGVNTAVGARRLFMPDINIHKGGSMKPIMKKNKDGSYTDRQTGEIYINKE